VEFCRDLLDWPLSVGKVHNVLQRAVGRARTYILHAGSNDTLSKVWKSRVRSESISPL
jgi:hypothetical protein